MNKNLFVKIIVDSVAFLTTVIGSSYIYSRLIRYDHNSDFELYIIGYIIYIVSLYGSKGYINHRDLVRISDLVASFKGAIVASIVFVAFLFFANMEFSRYLIISFSLFLPIATILGRLIANKVIAESFKYSSTERILIYGAGQKGREFQNLTKKFNTTFTICGFLDDSRGGDDIMGKFSDLSSVVIANNVNRLIVAIGHLSEEDVSKIFQETKNHKLKVSFIPTQTLMKNNHLKFRDFAGITMVANRNNEKNLIYSFTSRILDIVVAISALILSFPLFVGLFIYTRISDGGPIIFTQDRVGLDSKVFKLHKFRSMHIDSNQYERSPDSSEDPRITKLGKWIRKFSLDEIPQFYNVLKGEMSLVGPRPEMPFIVEQYSNFEKQRLSVKPGITGLWQISPGRKHDITDNLEYDLYYIENQSISLDIVLLALTGVFVLKTFTH
jgi:putative colanic acid biosysnthesis UDP-glucose lipid carrier transferase